MKKLVHAEGAIISTKVLLERSKQIVENIVNASKPYLKAHFGLILLACFVLTYNIFISRVQAYYKMQEMVYLEPENTAQAVQAISKYTPLASTSANEVKVALNVKENDEYLQKSATIATEGTKLEKEYIVENGDTLTGLASKFDLHVATIVDRNGLGVDGLESLTPGQRLIIPAKDTSSSQDWLAQLNQKKEDERAAAEAKRLAEARRTVVTRSNATTRTTTSTSGASLSSYNGNNSYPYGWCTYYAASRRNVPGQWGNAGQWLGSAQSAGYATGSYPQPGAIMVSSESWAGHVAYVESVDGDSFTISEMNYQGWGVVSRRTINVGAGFVKGFIY